MILLNYFITEKTLDVFIGCKINSFPIDCIAILKHYGFKLFTYLEIKKRNPQLYRMCIHYSDDAFKFKDTIIYNDQKPDGRIRFTLMHELGHFILDHACETNRAEREANLFASQMLAPRMAIHYSGCMCASDVLQKFKLSAAAAKYAFQDYISWYSGISLHKMKTIDSKMYHHFYNDRYEGFVYHISRCRCCGRKLLNHSVCTCTKKAGRTASRTPMFSWIYPEDKKFSNLENKWLYHGL